MNDDAAESDEAEGTVEERVRAHLFKDLALADTLSRGLANLGRTARWLERCNGWNDGARRIVPALRSYVDEEQAPPWQHGRDGLGDSRVGFRTGLACLTAARSSAVRERLEDAWAQLATLKRASIVDYEGNLTLVLDEHAVDEIVELLPGGSVRDVQRPAGSINLFGSNEVGVTNALGPVVAALQRHGIPVLHVAAAGSRGWILVPREHLPEAHDIASGMTRPVEAWPKPLRRYL